MNSLEGNLINFVQKIGKLKRIDRTGWTMLGVQNPESVADHCYRVSVLCMVLAPSLDIDQEKLIRMALIHDIGESKIGDIVIGRGKNINPEIRQKKQEMEHIAMFEIFKGISGSRGYLDLFKEVSDEKTKEAIAFRQIERLEMAFQAFEYEKEQGIDLSEFFDNAEMHMKDKIFKDLMKKIRGMRKT